MPPETVHTVALRKPRGQLTCRISCLYSAAMEEELNSLEQKINQLVELCQHLRADNVKLRQQLAAALTENRALHDKIGGARTRLEALLERVPESHA